MKFIVLLIQISLFFLIEAKTNKEEWKHFKEEFNKTYESNLEDQKRYKIFIQNLKNIRKHNRRYEIGEETYMQEVNKFADITEDEFTEMYGLYERSKPVIYGPYPNKTKFWENETEILDHFDWRNLGGFSSAKDQGRCGAGYIFSAIGNIEHYHYLNTVEWSTPSAQHVVDCLSNDTCGGGHPASVFQFVANFGIHLESDYYPYTGKQNICDNTTEPMSNVNLTDIGIVIGSDDDLYHKLLVQGPLTTCFSVTAKWRFYKSGVWYHNECAQQSNHCVLVVGYGTEDEKDYWIIKNSWGPDWGDEGYIKMARNTHKNYCGFNSALYLI